MHFKPIQETLELWQIDFYYLKFFFNVVKIYYYAYTLSANLLKKTEENV